MRDVMKLFDPGFWTMKRRAWLYGVVVSISPLLIVVGGFTPELVDNILRVASAVLAVGGGTMALTNLTPDNIVKVGLKVDDGTD